MSLRYKNTGPGQGLQIVNPAPDRSEREGEKMKFTWITKDGQIHTKTIEDYEERLDFITWLETSNDVVVWW